MRVLEEEAVEVAVRTLLIEGPQSSLLENPMEQQVE
jgi:hypothetical protein